MLFLFKQSWLEWVEDKSPKTAASLAYYTLFALGPLLVVVVAIAGLVFGAEAARGAITGQLSGLLGRQAGEAAEGLMAAGWRGGAGAVALVVGIVTMVLGAAAAFAQLREGLNTTWEVEAKTVRGFKEKVVLAVRQNLLSFAGVVGLGFLLLVGLAVSAALTAVSTSAQDVLPGSDLAWQALHFLVMVGVVTLVFALLFKFLPDAKVKFRDCLFGGFFTSILFVLGQLALGVYLGGMVGDSRYGAAGAVPVLLIWIYYSSILVLFGAELTQVFANNYGDPVQPTHRAEPLQEAVVKRHERPSREGTERRPGKPSEAQTT